MGPYGPKTTKADDKDFYQAIDYTFYGLTGVIIPSARDLQAFRVFSQHPAWVFTPVNPWKAWSIAFIKLL